jgi:hypothetical protein
MTKATLSVDIVRVEFSFNGLLNNVVHENQIYGPYVRTNIEIELHPYNIKREGGFCLSKS